MRARTPARAARGPRAPHAAVFAALGDETRLGLLGQLRGGTRSLSQLSADSRLTRQAITKHLKVMERAGMVLSKRSGRETRFELVLTPLHEARAFLEQVSAQWDEALARLQAFVERED